MLDSGTFIQNRYEIISHIGSGGMADVYKAKDHKLNRFVAVKVLKKEFQDDREFISKFRVEAQSAAGLAHGNIVNIYDVGGENGIYYIVMEFVEGITLKEYITEKGRLSVKEMTSIALQISAGLEAAHNNGIIHRDVKPQNIMISTDGKVKVADFGIARVSSGNTIISNAAGSVHYSSPEQARGGYSDEKSDIYSLGITMYEMLTGHVPFDADTPVAVALRHLQEEVPSPKEEFPDIPYSTSQIVVKCTQKSPDRRYPNMSELIHDLRESLVNPDGDFVTWPVSDRVSQTIVMSRDELDQIKSEQQRMPSYDESMDLGAAANMHSPENDSTQDRAYKPGSYYQKSQYQEVYSGKDDSSERSMDDFDYIDDLDDYDPLYGDYDDDDGYGSLDGDSQADYETDDEMQAGKDKRKKKDADSDLNPQLEKAVTIGGIIVAVIIGCVFIALLANAVGLLNFGSSRNSDSGIIVDSETETETETEKAPETAAQTEPVIVIERTTEPQTEEKISFALSNFSNMELSQAEAMLVTQGLDYKVDETQFSDNVEKGHVISTDPESGEMVTAGDVITLYVSQGPEMTVIIDEEDDDEVLEDNDNTNYVYIWELTGYTVSRAEEALDLMGLTPAYEYETSDIYAEGFVTRTSADASGGNVPAGSTVTLYISTGPPAKVWRCNAELQAPDDYQGEPVRITLKQNGNETTIFEGTVSFPYLLQVTGESGVSTGTAYVYILDPDTYEVIKTVEYAGVEFAEGY